MKVTPSLVDEIGRDLRTAGWLPPGAKVVVGVSGGPDSLALLGVLRDLGHPIVVAHLDHQLRPESGAEAEFVQKLALQEGMPCIVGRESVIDWARQHRRSVEESGRILRYRFLYQVALQAGTPWVAVGHTADDQAETVLMHLLRGSGPEGLRGMPMVQDLGAWVEDLERGRVFLIRPLLKATREQTEDYCQANHWEARRDSTNLGSAYLRGRLRSEVLPFLKRFNPQLRRVLCRLADVMAGEVDILEAARDRVWLGLGIQAHDGQVRIPRQRFNSEPKGIRREVLRKACRLLLPGVRDLEYHHVEQALEFAARPRVDGRTQICRGLVLRLGVDELIVSRAVSPERLRADWEGSVVPPGGSLRLQESGWVISSQPVQAWDLRKVKRLSGRWEVWLDFDRVAGELRVRRRERGERFRPLGMSREVRVSDFLSTHHLPAELREGWPLVCDDTGIVWVPGLRIAERVKLRSGSHRGMHLQVWRGE
jgi:tRNA(Ile)-lysidine synthase